MRGYLLLLDDVRQIDKGLPEIVSRCSLHFGQDLPVYRPLPFADHSGFTETVGDEIEFIIGAQCAEQSAHLDSETFIQEWELAGISGKRVVELSGGWRKFLGIALFTNRVTAGKIYVDVTSHLAEERLKKLLQQLQRGGEGPVVFCDYDSLLLYRLGKKFQLLYDSGGSVYPVAEFPAGAARDHQSNYEHA